MFWLSFCLLFLINLSFPQRYLNFGLYESSDCSYESMKVQMTYPIDSPPNRCFRSPIYYEKDFRFIELYFDEDINLVNYTLFDEDNNGTCANFTGAYNTTINECTHLRDNITDFYVNITIREEYPFAQEDILPGLWFLLGFYKDFPCEPEDRWSYYGTVGTIYSGGIEHRGLRANDSTRYQMFVTDEFIVQYYGENFLEGESFLLPRDLFEDQCRDFPIYKLTFLPNKVILNISTEDEIFDENVMGHRPIESAYEYMHEVDSLSSDCDNYYAVRPIKTDFCSPQDQFMYQVSEERYYASTFRERSSCGGDADYIYLLRRRVDEEIQTVFEDLCAELEEFELGGQTLKSYVHFSHSNNPSRTNLLANAWTHDEDKNCDVNITENPSIMRNPTSLSAVFFDEHMFCGTDEEGGMRIYYSLYPYEGKFDKLPHGGQSFQGYCEGGVLHIIEYMDTKSCVGDMIITKQTEPYCVSMVDKEEETFYTRLMCFPTYCGEYSEFDVVHVCSGMGECVARDTCECEGFFGGLDTNATCDTWFCDGVDKDDEVNVCLGHGECVYPELDESPYCECVEGYRSTGISCEVIPEISEVEDGENYAWVIPVVLLPVTGTWVVISLFCCCFVSCIGCLMCFFICLIVSIAVCITRVLFKYRSKVMEIGDDFEEMKAMRVHLLSLMRKGEMTKEKFAEVMGEMKNLNIVPYKDLRLDDVLGEGGSRSTVFKARWKNKNTFVAYKSYKSLDRSMYEFQAEATILSFLRHPNILKFYGCVCEGGGKSGSSSSSVIPRFGIIMEYCESGDLHDHIVKQKLLEHKIPWKDRIRYLSEIARGMDYLHSFDEKNYIIHRDLKPKNILMKDDGSLRIIDFGLSKVTEWSNNKQKLEHTQMIGTPSFMAPEVLLGTKDYDRKIDVYSYGIIMYCLLTHEADPYQEIMHDPVVNLQSKINNNPNFRPTVPTEFKQSSKLSEEEQAFYNLYIELMELCWSSKTDTRPFFNVIMERLKPLVDFVDGKKKNENEEVEIELRDGKDGVRREPPKIGNIMDPVDTASRSHDDLEEDEEEIDDDDYDDDIPDDNLGTRE